MQFGTLLGDNFYLRWCKRLGKKYLYSMALSRREAEEFIGNKGREIGLYVRYFGGELIIRKPKLVFGLLPVNFQVSFIAHLFEKEGGTIIIGKFDAPRLFYQTCISVYLLFSCLFLLITASKYGLELQTLIALLLLGVSGLIIIKGYIGVSKIFFAKQNNVVLEFFQSIASEYPSKK